MVSIQPAHTSNSRVYKQDPSETISVPSSPPLVLIVIITIIIVVVILILPSESYKDPFPCINHRTLFFPCSARSQLS